MKILAISFVIVAVLLPLPTPALAGDDSRLRIEEAKWKREKRTLEVEGRARRGGVVVVTDATSGARVGAATADKDGEWDLDIKGLAPVPCRIRATFEGQAAERAVEDAPRDCSNAVRTLSSLAVRGPAEAAESSVATFEAIATFSDGSTGDVTDKAGWRVSSRQARIRQGVLAVPEVSGDQQLTVTASYSYGGASRSVRKKLLVRDGSAAVLASLSVTGPPAVDENGSASFTATAFFADSTTRNVTTDARWSVDSSAARISNGVLTASEVEGDQRVTVSAFYTTGEAGESDDLQVIIRDSSTPNGSHVGRFASYEGTRTCLTCHLSEAKEVHASVHYQWQGDARESLGLDSTLAGKLGGINDFCIYPDINWIGTMTNLDGKHVDGGCAKCHAGLGAKPSPEPTAQQLENIDCLLCHSPSYKRKVGTVGGSFRFVPDEAAMPVSLMQAAVDIHLPDSNTCLNCHTRAGGGNNFKRGDIEEAHRNPSRSFDVHMAPRSAGGAGLDCLDCHRSVAHRVAGRGVDLRPRELPDTVDCANCHSDRPHGESDLDRHTARVACTACHIPGFAKVAPTDMFRDWSAPGDVNPTSRLYEPHMLMASHVQPEYRFFNGTSRFYQFGSRAIPGESGRIEMAAPQGSIDDPGAKILAFKRHQGRQPIDPASRRLLPLKIGIFFQTGNVDQAVVQGANAVGWAYNGHSFAETERWMGLFHEVAPADQALSCGDCHGGSRLDFATLGYQPRATRNGKPLCTSCHGAEDEDDDDDGEKGFVAIHRRHVKDKKLDCSNCHGFSKATN